MYMSHLPEKQNVLEYKNTINLVAANNITIIILLYYILLVIYKDPKAQ
jgi:hypothetical protein